MIESRGGMRAQARLRAVLRLTVPHYYDFGADAGLVGSDLGSARSWDALRTRTDGPFALPSARAELDRQASERADLRARARTMAGVLKGLPPNVVSYGVGTALFERCLEWELPELELTLTDYAPATVERLRELFPKSAVLLHDLREDPPVAGGLHLMHRVDTEFDDPTWLAIFDRFRGETILFAAGPERTRDLLKRRFKRAPAGAARAGWSRNRAALEALWSSTHSSREVDLDDLAGWLLTPRS